VAYLVLRLKIKLIEKLSTQVEAIEILVDFHTHTPAGVSDELNFPSVGQN
jgi:hypothetical protein